MKSRDDTPEKKTVGEKIGFFTADNTMETGPAEANNADAEKTLINILNRLAEAPIDNKAQFIDISKSLKDVYANLDRHLYSDIFNRISRFIPIGESILTEQNNPIETLGNNIQLIKEVLFDKNTSALFSAEDNLDQEIEDNHLREEDFQKKFFKLYDHVLLECARITFSLTKIQCLDDKLNSLYKTARKTKKINETAEKVVKEAESFRTTIVAILAIFISIVLSMATGIKFTEAAFSSMATVPTSKIVILLMACGFILFNTTFYLLHIVGQLMSRNLYVFCKNYKIKDGEEENIEMRYHCHTCTGNCWKINRIRKRAPYAFWINLAMIFVSGILIWMRAIGWVADFV